MFTSATANSVIEKLVRYKITARFPLYCSLAMNSPRALVDTLLTLQIVTVGNGKFVICKTENTLCISICITGSFSQNVALYRVVGRLDGSEHGRSLPVVPQFKREGHCKDEANEKQKRPKYSAQTNMWHHQVNQ